MEYTNMHVLYICYSCVSMLVCGVFTRHVCILQYMTYYFSIFLVICIM
jgi:hypothetical protein